MSPAFCPDLWRVRHAIDRPGMPSIGPACHRSARHAIDRPGMPSIGHEQHTRGGLGRSYPVSTIEPGQSDHDGFVGDIDTRAFAAEDTAGMSTFDDKPRPY